MHKTKTILVVGGTGMLGAPVARQLHKQGYRVRIYTRDQEKAKQVLGPDFEYFEGDVQDYPLLVEAANDCYGVHINLNSATKKELRTHELPGTQNVVRAAAFAEVQRISMISGAGTVEENDHFPLAHYKLLMHRSLKDSGIPYTIFCCSHFMDALPLYIQGKRASIVGNPQNSFYWIASEDYARMVAASFSNKQAEDKIFYIYGPRSYTMEEAITLYRDVLRPEAKISRLSPSFFKTLGALTFNPKLRFLGDMFEYFDNASAEAGDPNEANEILGPPQLSLEDWIQLRKKQ